MTPTAATAVRKFHASLNVSDLNRSVAFYRVLFGKDAAKSYPDYAKFEIDDPALVLSLTPSTAGRGGNLNHVGLRVTSSAELVEIQRRIEAAGFPTRREEGVECCYALQTKFWISDPDGAMWEIYVFHEDIQQHGKGSVPKTEQAPGESVSRWSHQLPNPLPAVIPHVDNSLDEVQLEGTLNLRLEPGAFATLVADAFRALRPGGTLRVHGLAADRPLGVPLPPLPGPAADVQHVPAATEPLQALTDAQFAGVQVDALSESAPFTAGGVPMREIRISGRKPGYRPDAVTHHAIYLGPLAQVTDDFGNTFARGERVPLNSHDQQLLAGGPMASAFRFFEVKDAAFSIKNCC